MSPSYEGGEMKVFNPDKYIAIEVTLELVKRHRDAMIQARTGEAPGTDYNKTSDKDKMFNKAKALNLIIATQRDLITNARATIRHNSYNRWKKKYREEEKRREHPFDKEETDYSQLMYLLGILKACELDIIEADKSITIDDDFIIEKEDHEGNKKYELTNNFREMLEALEDNYEKLYLLLLQHKIVSAGVEEDEDLTDRQLEDEVIESIIEA